MAIRRIKWRRAAFEEIRRSPEVQSAVFDSTAAMEAMCGAGYYGSVAQGKTRFRGNVYTQTYKAMRDNKKNNTLLKALNSGVGRV